jgi:hypothetical protein
MHFTSARRHVRRIIVLGLASLLSVAALAPTSAIADRPDQRNHVHTVRPAPPEPIQPAIQQQRKPGKLGDDDEAVEVEQVAPEHRGKHKVDPIDMKVLVISANGQEQYDFSALTSELERIGIPYDVLIGSQHTLNGAAYTSLANVLSNGVPPNQGGHGYYQAIMLTTGNLGYSPDGGVTWVSAFSYSDWSTLYQYEAAFGIRQVTNYTYPAGAPTNYCLNLAPSVYINTTSTPLNTNLTSAGASLFGYLNAASPITIRYSWVYLAYPDPNNAANGNTLTPLLTAPDGSGGQYILASTCRFSDGRENIAVTAANNPNFVHSELLSYGLMNWVTRGRFLGERHVNMNLQPDDLLIDDDVWNPANSPGNGTYDPGAACIATATLKCPTIRMSGSDVTALVNWQNQLQTSSTTPGFRIEFPFVGHGTSPNFLEPGCMTGQGQPCVPDTLTSALQANQQYLNFVSHTYDHINLDYNCVSWNTSTTPATCAQSQATTYQMVLSNLQQNDQIATTPRPNGLGLANYSKDTFVQPDISGLNNSLAMQALYDFGIRYVISDTSQPGWNNPSFNAGIYSSLQPGILIIPRHPSNLFYNLYNPSDWVAEYNCFYYQNNPIKCGGTSFDQYRYLTQPIDYPGVLNHESDQFVQYLIKWDVDPIMFHQPNTVQYASNQTTLSDVFNMTLQKYRSMYTLPIRTLREREVGLKMAVRMAYNAAKGAGLTAQMVPCGTTVGTPSITLTSPTAALIPVTGVQFGGQTEVYGGQTISYIQMAAGQTTTLPLTCP